MVAPILQRIGTEVEGQTFVASLQTMTISSGGDLSSESPVSYEGGKIVLDPSLMIIGFPYAVFLDGEPFVAMKQQDGDIAIYGFEKH